MKKYRSHIALEKAWKVTHEGVALVYPICYFDSTIPEQLSIQVSIENVMEDIDFIAWPPNTEYHIVDSTGKVFRACYQKTQGYTWYIIPTEYRSGVFPGELLYVMTLNEVKQLLYNAIAYHKQHIANSNSLKEQLNNISSIQEILKVCNNHF